MINKIISGGQNGADYAGLVVAESFSIETGGYMPKGFRTLDGFKPEMKERFGMIEHYSSSYVGRTEKNVEESDGTIRLFGVHDSAGEKCTMQFIKKHKKPHFDVDLKKEFMIEDFVKWVHENNIQVLNVAGNSKKHLQILLFSLKGFLCKRF